MSSLSTHVLDTALGRPAGGIRVVLEADGVQIGSGVTDADGRVRDWHTGHAHAASHPAGHALLHAGRYRLLFHVADYFRTTSRESFYEVINIDFRITRASEHYHVPLLLSPFGYSTYRGS